MSTPARKPSFILGVDPGLGGALALYDARSTHHQLIPTPPAHRVFDAPLTIRGAHTVLDARALADLVGELVFDCEKDVAACVENVNSRPRQAGAFNFGLSTGIVHGVLAAHGIPMALAAPAKWKASMGLARFPEETPEQNKSRARALATQLFPSLTEQFKRVKDDGRAEAMLLAVYFANLESF